VATSPTGPRIGNVVTSLVMASIVEGRRLSGFGVPA
jgi:hypothetical protein